MALVGWQSFRGEWERTGEAEEEGDIRKMRVGDGTNKRDTYINKGIQGRGEKVLGKNTLKQRLASNQAGVLYKYIYKTIHMSSKCADSLVR